MHIEPFKSLSPIDAFRSLRSFPHPFIISGGAYPAMRRYSYVGAAPMLKIITENGKTRIIHPKGNISCRDPFSAISSVIDEYGGRHHGPFPFNSGLTGYLSYELKVFTENLPSRPLDIEVPDCLFGLYDPLFIYDHLKESGYVVSAGINRETLTVKEFKKILSSPPAGERSHGHEAWKAGDFHSNMTEKGYKKRFERLLQYIAAGEIYQANLSQRLVMKWNGDPFSLYLNLRDKTPAPFDSFMDFGSFQIICNSPERFLRTQNGHIETSPIKGTRPRGVTKDIDIKLIDELLQDKKELAEHIMIVDLERNDLGRICKPGSISIAELMKIETLPTLHHMTSTIRGRLKNGVSAGECIRSTFPGGSVTGAPKIRAMEIIDELEPTPRGIYTGALGYIDISGNMDLTMAIRTAIMNNGRLCLNVGGGIVSDSSPEREYRETMLKARSFLAILLPERLPI